MTAPQYNSEERCIDEFLRSGVNGIVLLGGRHVQTADDIITTAFTLEAGMAGARRFIDQGYTAACTANDLMALGAISAANAMGRSVPDEFSVVGYDGTALTGLTAPPLTTLRQPFEKMTRLVVEAMLSELDGSPRYRDHYVFEPELVSRGSSGRLAMSAAPDASVA